MKNFYRFSYIQSTMASDSTFEIPKISRLQNHKGFALCGPFVTELMRRDGDAHVLNETPPSPVVSTQVKVDNWRKIKSPSRILFYLNLAEKSASLVALVLISDASTKAVLERLCNRYQQEIVQSHLTLLQSLTIFSC